MLYLIMNEGSLIPKPKSNTFPFLIMFLILVGLGTLGYWIYQKYTPKPYPVTVEDQTIELTGTDETDLSKLDRCVPINEAGATKCYSQKTKERCLKLSTDCRWAVATP